MVGAVNRKAISLGLTWKAPHWLAVANQGRSEHVCAPVFSFVKSIQSD